MGFTVYRDGQGTATAMEVANRAMTKMVTEAQILQGLTAGPEALGKMTYDGAWNKIAQLHAADAQLDARSIGLIKRQTQRGLLSYRSKLNPDTTLKALIEKVQTNVALDTVRNEYLLHTKLYVWLIADHQRTELSALNKRVYDELFLTPASDPWLGLYSPEVYTALEGGGLVQ